MSAADGDDLPPACLFPREGTLSPESWLPSLIVLVGLGEQIEGFRDWAKREVSSPRKPSSPTSRVATDIPVLEGVMGVAVGGREV